MFLAVLPFVNMIKAFNKYKFSRRQHRRKIHKKRGEGQLPSPGGLPGHARAAGAGAAPFGFGRGGMGGMGMGGMGGVGGMGGLGGMGGSMFSPFFSGGQQQPTGNLPTAHISEVSVHSMHSRRSRAREPESSDDSDTDSCECHSSPDSQSITEFASRS